MEKDTYNLWKSIADDLKATGWKMPEPIPQISIRNAGIILRQAYEFCLLQINPEAKYEHAPELDQVIDWLSDNHRTGLFLYGQCGRGKTFLARYVLPLVFQACNIGIISYYDMTYASRHTDEVLSFYLLALDDIGTEQKYNDFGTIRHTLDEVIDSAEKNGKLLILTSNLTKDELIQYYGERVYDRICKLTTRIVFKGKSFRQ